MEVPAISEELDLQIRRLISVECQITRDGALMQQWQPVYREVRGHTRSLRVRVEEIKRSETTNKHVRLKKKNGERKSSPIKLKETNCSETFRETSGDLRCLQDSTPNYRKRLLIRFKMFHLSRFFLPPKVNSSSINTN